MKSINLIFLIYERFSYWLKTNMKHHGFTSTRFKRPRLGLFPPDIFDTKHEWVLLYLQFLHTPVVKTTNCTAYFLLSAVDRNFPDNMDTISILMKDLTKLPMFKTNSFQC